MARTVSLLFILYFWGPMFSWLLNPHWNHWLSLQCDWPSAMRFIHERTIFYTKSHLFREWDRKKPTNHITGKWKTIKPLFGKFDYQIVRFQNESNKVALDLGVVQFWSEIILVNSNRCALVRFWNLAYNFGPNCTPLSSITIMNLTFIFLVTFEFDKPTTKIH